jgi:protein tyrosine phosphatase (PTP) superfamily phosphohydrolase (DUF442 family)
MSVLLDRLYHLHWVSPDVARSAQPYLGFYAAFLKPHGFKSLINLRGENARYRWWRSEKRVAAALGIAHFDVRLSSRNLPSRSGLRALFDALDAAKAPILIKCSGGQDRSAFAGALYILKTKGPSALAEARAQFAFWPYLHHPKRHQLWLKQFPTYALEEASGMELSTWARERYRPQAFADWLRAKGLEKSFRTLQAEMTG